MKALSFALVTVFLLTDVSSASAQWTRVDEVPTTNIYTVSANADTIVAGADSLVYTSTNGGVTWKGSATVAAGVTSVQAVVLHNGRLYAGTFGQGVFVSDDLGDTWLGFNQGLVGGIFNTQLFIVGFAVHDDKLYAATSGAGAWARNISVAGSWSHFGNAFEPNAASNMNDIAVGGTRLLACAGFNGMVFFRDPSDSDWTVSWLNNVGLAPGLAALTAIWTGSRWLVGANTGVFHSPQGQSPWTFSDVGLGTLFNVAFALRSPRVFASFGTSAGSTIEFSIDGASWQVLEFLPFTFVFELATHDDTLYAARADGLWRRSIATVATKAATLGGVKALYRTPRK